MTHGKAKLDGEVLTVTLGKKETKYVVKEIKNGALPCKMFSLTKDDGEVIHVGMDQNEVFCDCKSSTYRPYEPCKHIRILRAVGLMKGPE